MDNIDCTTVNYGYTVPVVLHQFGWNHETNHILVLVAHQFPFHLDVNFWIAAAHWKVHYVVIHFTSDNRTGDIGFFTCVFLKQGNNSGINLMITERGNSQFKILVDFPIILT